MELTPWTKIKSDPNSEFFEEHEFLTDYAYLSAKRGQGKWKTGRPEGLPRETTKLEREEARRPPRSLFQQGQLLRLYFLRRGQLGEVDAAGNEMAVFIDTVPLGKMLTGESVGIDETANLPARDVENLQAHIRVFLEEEAQCGFRVERIRPVGIQSRNAIGGHSLIHIYRMAETVEVQIQNLWIT